MAGASLQVSDTVVLVRAWRFRLPDFNLHNRAMLRMDIRELYVLTRSAIVSLLWLTTSGAIALATASGMGYARLAYEPPLTGVLFVFAALIALASAALLAIDYTVRATVFIWRAGRRLASDVYGTFVFNGPLAIIFPTRRKGEKFAAALDARFVLGEAGNILSAELERLLKEEESARPSTTS